MIGVALATLLLGLSACGGSDGDKADPKPTKTSESPTPATPAQPEGADGVTVDIANWDAYADDPAVLAWKQATEAINASANERKVVPTLRKTLSKKLLRKYVGNIKLAWKNDWHVSSVVSAKVDRSRPSGSQTQLVVCAWAPSETFRKKNGAMVIKPDQKWNRKTVEVKPVGSTWVVTSLTTKGTCTGGAPA